MSEKIEDDDKSKVEDGKKEAAVNFILQNGTGYKQLYPDPWFKISQILSDRFGISWNANYVQKIFSSKGSKHLKVISEFKDLLIDVGGDIGAHKRPSPESMGVSRESVETSTPPRDMLPESALTSPSVTTPPQPIEIELAKIKKMNAVSFREHLVEKFGLDAEDVDWIITQKITGTSFLLIPHTIFEKYITAAGPIYILKDYQEQLLNQVSTKSTVSQLSPLNKTTNATFINGNDEWEISTQKMITNPQQKTGAIKIEEYFVGRGKGKKYRYLFSIFEFFVTYLVH